MKGGDLYPESSRSLESLRQMRLMALLRDMIEAEGKVKTAATLGVNYRTLVRHEETGRLTDRMADALERHLLLGGGSAAAQQRTRVENLAERVESIQAELHDGLEVIREQVKALEEDHYKALRRLERRLARLESAKGAEGASGTVPPSQDKPVAKPVRRLYRERVTEEAELGEESVYGEATPVIVEWRRATTEYKRAVSTGILLDKAEARMRVLDLETELIDTHKLTLPPATYPWDGFDRREQLRLRELYMGNARQNRRRALLRRFLTFGLWRK